jgi:regulator of nonsense transcripts 2
LTAISSSQCNPPERAPRQTKIRTPIDLFIRHLIHDVLSKKTIDKVLKLLRKLDWNDPPTLRTLHRVFTKPHKIKYSNISLLAMLVYDLQRYHPGWVVGVVDEVVEGVRLGMERNVYGWNQRRVANVKFLGELYIYRLVGSGLVFDMLWSLVTFGHGKRYSPFSLTFFFSEFLFYFSVDGRPHPQEPSPLDLPDDFFRIRLICVLLDTCGMCFDRGSQKKKLDNFLIYFQWYIHCKKELPMDVEFMLCDSLEAVRPKFVLCKSVEEAARAVDEMLNGAFQMEGRYLFFFLLLLC